MITDEMVQIAFKTWWKLGWDFGDEDGDENDEDTMKGKDAQLAMRAALEAVAPMLIAQGMQRAIDMARSAERQNYPKQDDLYHAGMASMANALANGLELTLPRAQELDPK